MITFDSFPAAREGIMEFRAEHFGDVPEYLRPRFKDLAASPSPVDQAVNLGEFIFANREALGDKAKELGAGLIAFATQMSFHGLDIDDRGNRIVANLRKEIGEIKTAPAAPEPRVGSLVEVPAPTDDETVQ